MSDKFQLEAGRIIKTVSFTARGEAESQGSPVGTQITVVVSSELTACHFMTLAPEPEGIAPEGWSVNGTEETGPDGSKPDCFLNQSPRYCNYVTSVAYCPTGRSIPSESERIFAH
jgi:hypothetical protein